MAYTQYWSERESFLRRQERTFRNEWLHEVYYNHSFAVLRLRDGSYAVTDFRQDVTTGCDVIYLAEKQMILKLIEEQDMLSLFIMNAVNNGRTVRLDEEGIGKLNSLHSDGQEPDQAEIEFRDALKLAQEAENEVLAREKIVGTPEWRKSVEREVHEMAEQDRARLKEKPAIAKWFVEPSVRKRLKDEKAYVYREQNRRIYEEQEAQRIIDEGSVSKNTIIAGIVSLVGILLFYLLVSLHGINFQFLPALVCGVTAIILLIKDQNYDKKNMNARLLVWIITIVCFVLGVTAVASMLS